MYTAAQASGVKFVDVSSAYGEHKLCNTTSTPAMNAIRLGDDFSPIASLSNFKIIGAESFHPTPYGHELVADIIARSFSETTVGKVMSARNAPSIDNAYWQRGSDAAKVFRYQQLSPDIAYVALGGKYSETTPVGVFAPDSKVTLTIQGGEIAEQSLTASTAGDVSYDVLTSALKRDGVYTIYLHGATPSGEKIALYRMIAVGDDEGDARGVDAPKNASDANVSTSSRKRGSTGEQVQNTKEMLETKQQTDIQSPDTQDASSPKQALSFPYLMLLCLLGATALLVISVQVVRYVWRIPKGRDNKV